MMEKRSVLSSPQQWKLLREVRNAFSYDYPESERERSLELQPSDQIAKAEGVELVPLIVLLQQHHSFLVINPDIIVLTLYKVIIR